MVCSFLADRGTAEILEIWLEETSANMVFHRISRGLIIQPHTQGPKKGCVLLMYATIHQYKQINNKIKSTDNKYNMLSIDSATFI